MEKPTAGCRGLPVVRCGAGGTTSGTDEVAEETAVALVYNGLSHAVMMATPGDLEDFAVGFSLSEGILSEPAQVYDLEVVPACRGMEVRMEIASERFVALKERRRNLAGRTGCGICGAESLDAVFPAVARVAAATRIDHSVLLGLLDALTGLQPLRARTGATHACGWGRPDGTIEVAREDVGRHNALDKVIGALARKGIPAGEGVLLLTSRASYELVQKAARAGVGVVAAVSAPTALAVELAEDLGITLAGFVRNGSSVLYTHARRVSVLG